MSVAARILALIPAYNEEAAIARVVAGARRFLPVLVVDDGSRDATAERAREAGAEVLVQKPNQGKGAALKAGFRLALARGYDAVLTLDADGQHDPAEIPAFLEAYRARGAELIIGARDFRQMPPVRKLANTLGTIAFSRALGRTIRDNQSGYRLIGRRLLEAVLESGEEGFEFEVDMIVTCVREGCRLEDVPIRTIYAGEASHIRPGPHLVRFLRMCWRTPQRVRRGSKEA